jgi:hypothetical protein
MPILGAFSDFLRFWTIFAIFWPFLSIFLPNEAFDVRVGGSVRPKQEFSLSAETEYSAAKNHQIFGFGRIFGTFLYFRPKFVSLIHNQLKIRIINAKFD